MTLRHTQPLFQKLAGLVDARARCAASGNSEWFEKHKAAIEALVSEHLPTGSGFDAGTTLDLDATTPEKLVFNTSFHHMEDGSYTGWSEHRVIVRASLVFRYTLQVSGRNRNDIKEYVAATFGECLDTEV